jgi:quinol monooxygenase YgiN
MKSKDFGMARRRRKSFGKAPFAALLALALAFLGCQGNSPSDPDPADKTALQTALADAATAKDGVTASANGADVPVAAFWVTQAQYTTFITAIAAAQAAYDIAEASQATVDAAATTLETATAAFLGQKQAGTDAGPAPTYGISLDLTGTHTFTAAIAGYGAQTGKSVTITNTGSQTTGALTADLSGTNVESFTLSTTTIPSIATDGDAAFTVVPNTGLEAGTYTATVTVSGENSITASFGVSFTVTLEPTYGINLDVSGTHTFTAAIAGYGAQTAKSVTISNTGNQATGALILELSGANSGSFILLPTAISSIAVGGNDAFTVEPNTGLAAGTYTATVTVSGDNGITASFDVSFTVNALVNAATPSITVQPTSATYAQNDAATALTVTATRSDGGTLSYQWYSNETNNTDSGAAISGETGVSYTPSTAVAGNIYYYVVVTNTINDNGDGGTKTATETSSVAAVTVNPALYGIDLGMAGTHTFTAAIAGYGAQTGKSVTITNTGNQATGALTADLSGTNAGSFTLSTTTIPSIAVDGDAAFTVVPNTGLVAGTYTATVTVSGGNGITASFDVNFTVNALVNAATPSITGQPVGATYAQNAAATALTVTATRSDGGTLSYQWYKNTSNSNSGGTSLGSANGAQTASYTPSTASIGTAYYYVVVTNTKSGVTGTPTATETSNVATVTVNASLTINVGFNFGAITITGNDGVNVISRGADTGKPTSLALSVDSAAGYSNVQWYVDGNTATPVGAGSTITITAAAYDIRNHSVTFTGTKDGIPYSQLIPFTVTQ